MKNDFGKSGEKIKISDEILKRIINSLEELHYGSLEIFVHDSQIVQIEKKEKVRFQK